MNLKELWARLVAKATEEEAAAAARFEQHVHGLSEEIEDVNPFHEYPKWVHGKVVQDADEESQVRAAAEPAAATSSEDEAAATGGEQ